MDPSKTLNMSKLRLILMEKNVILDTNFLVYIFKYKIDLFSELDRICNFKYKTQILTGSIEELEKVKPTELNIIKQFIPRLNLLNSKIKNVDDELVNLSKENIIATQDKNLKKRLNGQVIIIRQKKYLILI